MRPRHWISRRLRRDLWRTAAQRARDVGRVRATLKFTLRDLMLVVALSAASWALVMPWLRPTLRFLDGVSGAGDAALAARLKWHIIATFALLVPIGSCVLVLNVKMLSSLARHSRIIRLHRMRRRLKPS